MRWGVSGWVIVALMGCAYSPPIVTTHGGAPAHIAPERGGISIASGVTSPVLARGALAGSIPLHPSLRLEIGGDGAGLPNFIGWLMGRIGLRYSGWVGSEASVDLEAGLGAGVGGDCSDDEWDPCHPTGRYGVFDRPAFGGYVGGGVAHWFGAREAFFFRVRAQVGQAASAPATFYPSAVMGFDLPIEDVRFYFAVGGYGAFIAGRGTYGFPLAEMGLSIPIGDVAGPE